MILNGTLVEVTLTCLKKPLSVSPIGSFPRCNNAPVGEGGTCTKEKFIETLPDGRSYSILNIDRGSLIQQASSLSNPDTSFLSGTIATTAKTRALRRCRAVLGRFRLKT